MSGSEQASAKQTHPILLYNDECGVCRRIAAWVQRSGERTAAGAGLIERPIGDDPEALRSLNPNLDIWDAYETIHLLMPDGSMKLGGEAVAEVLRSLRSTRWLAQSLAFSVAGFRPFQCVLNLGYAILSDVRPLFGCESCGTPSLWLRPLHWVVKTIKHLCNGRRQQGRRPHFTRRVGRPRAAPPSHEAMAVARQPTDSAAVAAWRNGVDPN